MGVLEQQLFDSTVPLIEALERICQEITADPSFAHVPHELTEDFPTLLFNFLKNFKAWKVPDEIKLTHIVKHALIALYQALEHLPPDEPEDCKMKKEFNTIIPRLCSKLQQIASIKAFDEERAKGQMQIASVGGVGNASAYMSLPGRMSNQQMTHELVLDPLFQLLNEGGSSTENSVFHNICKCYQLHAEADSRHCVIERVQLPKRDREIKSKWEAFQADLRRSTSRETSREVIFTR